VIWHRHSKQSALTRGALRRDATRTSSSQVAGLWAGAGSHRGMFAASCSGCLLFITAIGHLRGCRQVYGGRPHGRSSGRSVCRAAMLLPRRQRPRSMGQHLCNAGTLLPARQFTRVHFIQVPPAEGAGVPCPRSAHWMVRRTRPGVPLPATQVRPVAQHSGPLPLPRWILRPIDPLNASCPTAASLPWPLGPSEEPYCRDRRIPAVRLSLSLGPSRPSLRTYWTRLGPHPVLTGHGCSGQDPLRQQGISSALHAPS